MTEPKVYVPKYRCYRPKNLAVVRIEGRDIYLGAYGSLESRQRYDREIAEWLAKGRTSLSSASSPSSADTVSGKHEISVNEVLLHFLEFAKRYYSQHGNPGREYVALQYAIEPVKSLYGLAHAKDFGPLALKAVRQQLLNRGLCRNEINKRINRVRRVFKWAASEELIPIGVFEALRTVDGLRQGRSSARETEPVRPVDLKHVEAVLPYVSPQVAAMVRLQQLTGMRPGEVVLMRPVDIDRSGEIWIFEPANHKTKHRGFRRHVALGPQAQLVLQPYLDRPQEAYLFSPQESERWRNEARAETRQVDRKTKIYPCELRARTARKEAARKRQSKRPKRNRFDVDSYRRAITYGFEKAKKAKVEISHWHPHQLRHTHATEVRKKYGVEGAQVALGHARADVTEVYAERNLGLAVRIARDMG